MLLDYQINDVAPYINWDYFFYAWGMHNKPEAEKEKLRGEAEETLATLQSRYRTHAVFQLFEANSEDLPLRWIWVWKQTLTMILTKR